MQTITQHADAHWISFVFVYPHVWSGKWWHSIHFVESIFARAFARSYHHRLLMAVTCQLFNFFPLFLHHSFTGFIVCRLFHHTNTYHPLRSRRRIIHAACEASVRTKNAKEIVGAKERVKRIIEERIHTRFTADIGPMTVRTNWTFAW